MTTINLYRNNAFKWFESESTHVKGYLFTTTGELLEGNTLLRYFENVSDREGFIQRISSANGTFSAIIRRGGLIMVAVDRFRTFPIFYRKQGETIALSDKPDALFSGDEKMKIDEESSIVFSSVGYTLGNKTLLEDVFQVQAGEYLIFDSGKIKTEFYHQQLGKTREVNYEDAKQEFREILERITQRMKIYLKDKKILLPLSGGLDSRLIALLLKNAGFSDVVNFTFGNEKGNPEKVRAQIVSEKLGYRWEFVNYANIDKTNFHKTKQFLEFYPFESGYVSKFAFMQYFSAGYLTDILKVSPQSVVLPGHGGDFFSGSHLRSYMKDYRNLKTIASDLEYIHCKQVKKNSNERKLLRNKIQDVLFENNPLFHNAENWDLKERQAKYIINSCKLWDFYNLYYFMPLCDNEFMDFFVTLPFEYRINQKLYKEVVNEMFRDADISFPHDTFKAELGVKQKIKVMIKRTLPFLRKKKDLFQYDYFDFKTTSKPIVQELKNNNVFDKIISMNGILTEWYLLQIREKIK